MVYVFDVLKALDKINKYMEKIYKFTMEEVIEDLRHYNGLDANVKIEIISNSSNVSKIQLPKDEKNISCLVDHIGHPCPGYPNPVHK